MIEIIEGKTYLIRKSLLYSGYIVDVERVRRPKNGTITVIGTVFITRFDNKVDVKNDFILTLYKDDKIEELTNNKNLEKPYNNFCSKIEKIYHGFYNKK